MFTPIKCRLITVMGAAALASLIAVSVALAPPAKAAPTEDTVQSDTKGDRLPARSIGSACSSLGWPHYEQSCQFDLSRSADAIRTVRVLDLGTGVQAVN